MDRRVPRSLKIWGAIIIVKLLLVVSQGNASHDGLTLYVKRRFANTYLNLPLQNDLFLIKAGKPHNESKKLLHKRFPSLQRLEMTWFTSKYPVNYSLWASSSNMKLMQKPEITPIPLKGVVLPSKGVSFKISLPCTGQKDGFVRVNLVVNYTKHQKPDLGRSSTNRLQLTFTVHCNQSDKGSAKETTNTTRLNRTVVVTVSAVAAFVVVVLISVVFFWRFIKRIRKKFGFDVVPDNFSTLNEVSCHSSNVSVSPTSLPTVVYSPKREKSSKTIFTKIVKHEGKTEAEGQTNRNSGQSRSCSTHGFPTTSVMSFSRSNSRNHKSYRHLSADEDDNEVFLSNQPSVALLQDEEKPSPLSPSLTLARESEDKRQMYSTLNEYWAEEFGASLKSRDEIEVRSEVVGEGAFGRVYKGKFNQQREVAVKVCKDEIEFEQMVACINEAILIKTLEHENLLDLLGVVLQPTSPPFILTPFMAHGDLHKFLRHSRGIGIRRQLIGSRQLVNFGTQIACGMEYLASRKIVHRDLAARNCFVDEELNVKIGDLGLAKEIHQFDLYKMEKPGQLAVKWLAIESLLYYIFTEKTDIWSFGILLWELVTLGSQPYAGLDNHEVTPYLETGKRLSRPLRCPDDLFAIMYSCWLPEPEERPSFTILVHKLQDYEQRLKPACIAFEFDEDTIEMADDCGTF